MPAALGFSGNGSAAGDAGDRHGDMNYSNQVAEQLDGVLQGTNPAAVSS